VCANKRDREKIIQMRMLVKSRKERERERERERESFFNVTYQSLSNKNVTGIKADL
jgi:hypothetical protein